LLYIGPHPSVRSSFSLSAIPSVMFFLRSPFLSLGWVVKVLSFHRDGLSCFRCLAIAANVGPVIPTVSRTRPVFFFPPCWVSPLVCSLQFVCRLVLVRRSLYGPVVYVPVVISRTSPLGWRTAGGYNHLGLILFPLLSASFAFSPMSVCNRSRSHEGTSGSFRPPCPGHPLFCPWIRFACRCPPSLTICLAFFYLESLILAVFGPPPIS